MYTPWGVIGDRDGCSVPISPLGSLNREDFLTLMTGCEDAGRKTDQLACWLYDVGSYKWTAILTCAEQKQR